MDQTPLPPDKASKTGADAAGDGVTDEVFTQMDMGNPLAPVSTSDATQVGTASQQPAPADKTTHPQAGGADGKTSVDTGSSTSSGLSEMDLEKPEGQHVSLGDYEILQRLGAGGMGAVYKAKQVSLERDVALKVLFRSLAANKPDFVPRFYREAKVMAKLNHPNVITCYGVGEAHGLHYLAMEYVDGGNVADLLKKQGKFGLGDALHVTLACLYALQHAHEMNMVHRDIKPDNLLLTSKGVVKLADLGLAKALDDDMSLTQTGMGAGTPHFMSPEQTKSAKHVDARTDIYAVGCMLYKFLTGKVPFEGDTIVELFIAKEAGKYTPAKKMNPEVPDALDLLIDRMLAKKIELRPKSCADVAAQIEALGLANDQLSAFAGGASPKSLVPKSGMPPTVRMNAAQTSRPTPKTEVIGKKDAPKGDFWYVQAGKKDGKQIVQKLSKEQVMARLKEDKLSPTSQVSRDPKTGYRSIASYPDFEYAARSRIQKEKADRRGDKMKSFYENLEAEERSHKRWKFIRRFTSNTFGWLILLGTLALLAGLGYVVFLKWDDILKMFK